MGKSPYDVFKTDAKTEKDGIWINYGSFGFHVRRAGPSNKAFVKMLESKLRPHRAAIKRGTMDDKVADSIACEVFCKTVLINWRSTDDKGKHKEGVLPGKDGKEIPFSVEKAREVFTDLPELFNDLYEQAADATTFRFEDEAEVAGN